MFSRSLQQSTRTARICQRHLTQAQFYHQYSLILSKCIREISFAPARAETALKHRPRKPSTVHSQRRFKGSVNRETFRSGSNDASPESSLESAEEAMFNCEYIPQGLLDRSRQLCEEYKEMQKKLLVEYDSKTATRAGQLEKVVTALQLYEKAIEDLEVLGEMMNDPDMAAEAEIDYREGIRSLNRNSQALTEALAPPHQYAHLPAMVEIRPGTGGSEAAIFANDLYKMYLSYFSNLGWRASVVSIDTSEPVGGGPGALQEAIVSVGHPGAYNEIRLESGVHRVQRIPATETKGRVHTSTATVMVLPSFPEDSKDPDLDTIINPKDVRTEVMRSSGAGGQHVNTTDSAVRMTHVPSGIMVVVRETRSQLKNREKAWNVLRSRVAATIAAEKEEDEIRLRRQTLGMKGDKGGGGGGRGDKVRTYNFSQNRVTDHRSGTTVHDLEGIMRGDEEVLGSLINEVKKWRVELEVKALEN